MVYTTGDLIQDLTRKAGEAGEGLGNLGTGAASMLTSLWNPAELEGVTPFQQKVHKSGSKILAGATVFVAGTALLDMAVRTQKKARAEWQEKKLVRERLEQEEAKREKARQYREGASMVHGADMGKIVFEMFEQRTGHHRMGNSHFFN